MISYLVHSSILLAGCAIFYWLLLRQETFFQLNRGVLVGSILLSLSLPLISIPAAWLLFPSAEKIQPLPEWFASETPLATTHSETFPEATTPAVTAPPSLENTTSPNVLLTKSSSWSWSLILQVIYWVGLGIFSITFLVQLVLLLAKMAILESVQDGKFRIVELAREEAPYSFWNAIFINPDSYDLETYEQIIAHEKIHIEQKHFFDKLLAEILVIAFWFNPFVWWYRQTITNNLEYLTDAKMILQGTEKQSYQMSLLKVSVPQYPLNLSTNYNQSFLKNRIAMMNSKKSSVQSIWKYLFILPLLGLSILTLNAVHTEDKNILTTAIDTPAIEKEDKTDPPKNIDKQLLKLSQLVELINATVSDSIPPYLQTSKMPEFPYSEAEMKDKLANDPAFADQLVVAIDRYANEVSEWRVELDDANEAYLDKRLTEEKRLEKEYMGALKKKELQQKEKLYKKEKLEKNKIKNKKEPKEKKKEKEPKEKKKEKHLYQKDKSNAMELYRLEKSSLDSEEDHDLIRLSQTLLSEKDKKASHCCWAWPGFQEQLLNLVAEEGFVKNTQRVKLIFGADQLFLNGVLLASDRFDRYHELFHHFDINHSPGWFFHKEEDHIVLLDHPEDLQLIKKDLVNYLMQHQLMASPSEAVILSIPGPSISFNGKQLSQQHLKNIFEILKHHHIQPVPGKEIGINGSNKVNIHIGYRSGKLFIGSLEVK